MGIDGRNSLLRILIETGFVHSLPQLRDIFIVPELDAAGLATAMQLEEGGYTGFKVSRDDLQAIKLTLIRNLMACLSVSSALML